MNVLTDQRSRTENIKRRIWWRFAQFASWSPIRNYDHPLITILFHDKNWPITVERKSVIQKLTDIGSDDSPNSSPNRGGTKANVSDHGRKNFHRINKNLQQKTLANKKTNKHMQTKPCKKQTNTCKTLIVGGIRWWKFSLIFENDPFFRIFNHHRERSSYSKATNLSESCLPGFGVNIRHRKQCDSACKGNIFFQWL